MKLFIITLTSLIILCTPFYLKSQDSSETKEDWNWQWEWEEIDDWADWESKSPTISIHYGISDISRKDMSSSFADNALLELKLGYTTLKTSKHARSLNKYGYNYLFISRNSTGLANNSPSGNIGSTNWRFGFARSGGYGYKIGENASIIPYFTSSWDWTMIDFKIVPWTTTAGTPSYVLDEEIFKQYDDALRFGSSNEGGIRIQPIKFITFEAGYERSIVFERHLFWKWAGSGIIELAANGLLDMFIKEIIKSTPAAGPIVFAVLKSALGYGLYELRQEKMNWPFSSAPPIAFDNIKFGVTFTF